MADSNPIIKQIEISGTIYDLRDENAHSEIEATTSDVEALKILVGDTAVSEQINDAFENNPAITDVVYAEEDSSTITSVPLNADTLGGRAPDEFALVAITDDLQTQINNKAPAGYGLGGDYAAAIADANLAIATGKYALNENTLNLPISGMFGVLDVVSRRTDKMIFQTFYPGTAGYQGCLIKRMCVNDAWQPWEYVNPPMEIGMEFRTTERWQGKAVYTKLINFGHAVNGLSTFDHNLRDCRLIRYNGLIGNSQGGVYALPTFVSTGLNANYTYWCNATYQNVQLFVGAEAALSAYDFYCQLWYVKL